MSQLRPPRLSLVIFSLLLTAVIALGAAFLLRNTLQRRHALHKLRDTDSAQRLEGMIYVCRFAPSDPVLRDTLQRWLLDPANDDKLKSDIIRSLRCADIWGPSFGKAWLQWLDHLLTPDEKLSGAGVPLPGAGAGQRVGVCFEIARAAFAHQPVIADPDTAALLQKLARDPSPDVRYWAIRAAATLPEKSLASVLDIALRDSESVVVRHAKIIDALMRDQPPVPPYPDYLRVVTAKLQSLSEYYRNLSIEPSSSADADAALAASRLAPHFGTDPAADVLKPITWTGRDGYQLRELAVLENLPPRSIDLDIDNDWPPLVRVAAARASKNLPEPVLLNLFDADDSAVRLLACFLAIDRLAEPQLRQLIDRLNHTFYDNERICGALLIGLTGLESPVLDKRLPRENVWLVRQHIILAQWMLGQNPPGFDIDGLLTNSAFPHDATVLALLQRGRIDALDVIFQPFRADAGQLRYLLDHQRFDPILTRYLRADQPPFDLYADPATQQFQCDALRDWYMMTRARLHFDPARRQFILQP